MGGKRSYFAIIYICAIAAASFAGKRTDTVHVTGGLKADRIHYRYQNGDSIGVDRVRVDSCIQFKERTSDCTQDGSLWYLDNHLHVLTSGIVGTLAKTLFVQTDVVLDSNSTAQVSLIGTSPAHTLDSFPAAYFMIGKALRFNMGGIYSTKATTAGNITIRIKFNATVLCSSVIVLDNNETNQPWEIRGAVVCLDTGVSGRFNIQTGWENSIAGVTHNDRIATPLNGTTANTNIKQKIDFTFQFGTADVSNKIRSTEFILEEIH
jgi:hypothetical protein